MEDVSSLLRYPDLFGSLVFATSGALAAVEARMDVFGMAVLASVTAVGGGTLRDMMLGVPAFWLSDPTAIWLSLAATALCFVFARKLSESTASGCLLAFDAFGLAVFSVEGAAKALDATGSPAGAVVMGMLTGAAGGMIRDVLSAKVPLVFRKEIYATASLCGASLYVVLANGSLPSWAAIGLPMALTLLLRAVALRYKLALPKASFPKRG